MRVKWMLTLLVPVVMIAFLASGCGSKPLAEPNPEPVETIQTEHHTEDPEDTRSASREHEVDGSNPTPPPASEPADPAVSQDGEAQHQDSDKKELEISSREEDPLTTDSGVAEQLHLLKEEPRLMQISLQDTRDAVIKLHGTPESTFLMEHEVDPLTVYQYAEFTVGFNQNGTVEFVDITSPEADPGLKGLSLGASVSDCLERLGKPSIQTEYVLNYMSETAILKMDIDPNENAIHSIKLFALEA